MGLSKEFIICYDVLPMTIHDIVSKPRLSLSALTRIREEVTPGVLELRVPEQLEFIEHALPLVRTGHYLASRIKLMRDRELPLDDLAKCIIKMYEYFGFIQSKNEELIRIMLSWVLQDIYFEEWQRLYNVTAGKRTKIAAMSLLRQAHGLQIGLNEQIQSAFNENFKKNLLDCIFQKSSGEDVPSEGALLKLNLNDTRLFSAVIPLLESLPKSLTKLTNIEFYNRWGIGQDHEYRLQSPANEIAARIVAKIEKLVYAWIIPIKALKEECRKVYKNALDLFEERKCSFGIQSDTREMVLQSEQFENNPIVTTGGLFKTISDYTEHAFSEILKEHQNSIQLEKSLGDFFFNPMDLRLLKKRHKEVYSNTRDQLVALLATTSDVEMAGSALALLQKLNAIWSQIEPLVSMEDIMKQAFTHNLHDDVRLLILDEIRKVCPSFSVTSVTLFSIYEDRFRRLSGGEEKPNYQTNQRANRYRILMGEELLAKYPVEEFDFFI